MTRPPNDRGVRGMADLGVGVVVYGSGRYRGQALALARDPVDAGLAALKVRLARRGFQVVEHLPAGVALVAWADPATPTVALYAAGRFLAARESAP
jgi:hypothetical protein